MATLTDHITYADAHRLCSPARLWELFDGDRQRLNIAQECIDRHPADRVAVRLVHSPEHGSRDEAFTFGDLSVWSARFAHYLAARGIGPGDRAGARHGRIAGPKQRAGWPAKPSAAGAHGGCHERHGGAARRGATLAPHSPAGSQG